MTVLVGMMTYSQQYFEKKWKSCYIFFPESISNVLSLLIQQITAPTINFNSFYKTFKDKLMRKLDLTMSAENHLPSQLTGPHSPTVLK